MITNPFVQLVAVVWFFATIACFATKNSEPIGAAAGVTFLVGVGYLCLRS